MRRSIRHQGFGQCGASAFAFEFDIDAGCAVKNIEYLTDLRDALAAAGIKRLNLVPRLVLYGAGAVRGSFER